MNSIVNANVTAHTQCWFLSVSIGAIIKRAYLIDISAFRISFIAFGLEHRRKTNQ